MEPSAAARRRAMASGLAAAILFGLSAPASKLLVPELGPLALAALLYLGAGLALSIAAIGPRSEAPLARRDVGWLLAAIGTGGVLAPVLMLHGLARVSGVTGSLLLNLEAPFTIAIAVLAFREHLGAREWIAAALVVLGAAVLATEAGGGRADAQGILAITAACLCWAMDTNIMQRLSLRDPVVLVRWKGLGAGAASAVLAIVAGQPAPRLVHVAAGLALGAASYGLSLVLHVRAMRELGAARQAALFATAPFAGALAAVPLLGERPGPSALVAGTVMAAGVVLLARARHGHVHVHEAIEHEHLHVHDEHHRHEHEGLVPSGPHSHPHRHEPLIHDHPHASDAHHRHGHGHGRGGRDPA